ncbi:hypothetical protein [Streptomyces fuscichromogenes]|uniref:Uncharacterized protein n=1 Tax=Streptomyces fuscichromogenes TaxID=1324013 RepID=A0A917XMP1_9ACTN|nr:hypothetical protein [Streptomyces fuscichromogenes]GGN41176.1 hypothetical protein GCM10011578_089150 [Streptomyces fuscichromogenes]
MSSADRPHDQLCPSEGVAYDMITVEELLRQLDRVAPSKPGYDQEGLDRLMAWMAEDDPDDHDVAEVETGARSYESPTTGKILIVGERAGSAEFIKKVCEFSAPTEFVVSEQQLAINAFFGRITLSESLHLYNIAPPDSVAPPVWDVLRKGAVGAVVLADPRRLVDCHDALDYLDGCGMPYVLALRGSPGICPYDLAEIREALQLAGDVPVLFWEPDRKVSAASALIALVEAALEQSRAAASAGDMAFDEELAALTLLAQLESHLKPTPT